DDETGQSVRFTMHQAQRACPSVEQLAPPRQRRRDAAAKKILVYGLAGIERPYTGTYLRSRAECRARQKCAVGRNDFHRLAARRVARHLRDCAGEYPRMTLLERLVP